MYEEAHWNGLGAYVSRDVAMCRSAGSPSQAPRLAAGVVVGTLVCPPRWARVDRDNAGTRTPRCAVLHGSISRCVVYPTRVWVCSQSQGSRVSIRRAVHDCSHSSGCLQYERRPVAAECAFGDSALAVQGLALP